MGKKTLGIIFTIILCAGAMISSPNAHARESKQSHPTCGSHVSYEEIQTTLFSYGDLHPDFVNVFSIGTSVKGRHIYAIRISQNPQVESIEPEIRIVGAIHGDECQSSHMVMRIITWLVTGYGFDPMVDNLVDGAEILLIPLVNPDGYESLPQKRNNGNDVDLNRDMGFGWSQPQGYPFSQPETIALRNISQNNSFTVGLSYHTQASYVNGPWNYHPFRPIGAPLIEEMGTAYAQNTGYQMVFGWDWYQIGGDVNDWSLGTEGTLDWTIELSSDWEMNWDSHRLGMFHLLEWGFRGIEGVVTDEKTGRPLHGRIVVNPEREPVFTDGDLGDYHQILAPGTYDVTAVANGYQPQTTKGIEVKRSQTVPVNFALVPCAWNYFAFAINTMIMGQEISNEWSKQNDYQNTTLTSDCLGPRDGLYYSLGPGGEITLDMGEKTPIPDGEGYDLLVYSGTDSPDPATVFVAEHQDGPYVEIASGTQNIHGDIQHTGFTAVRYVRIVDDGDAVFGSTDGGYDLDAIENLSLNEMFPDKIGRNCRSTTAISYSSNIASQQDQLDSPKPDINTGAQSGCRFVPVTASQKATIYPLIF